MSYNYAHEQKAYDHGYFVGVSESAAKIAALERRCLIAERVIDEAELKVSPVWMAFVLAERQLIAEGKLPQIEVKP